MSDENKVVSLTHARVDAHSAREIVEDMRQMIDDGEMKAFAAIVIEPGGELQMFVAKVLPCTRLEMAGAVSALAHAYHNGEDLYE